MSAILTFTGAYMLGLWQGRRTTLQHQGTDINYGLVDFVWCALGITSCLVALRWTS